MTRKRRNNGFLIFFITLFLLSLSLTFASNRVKFQGQTQPIITKPAPAPSPPAMLVEDMIVVKFKPIIGESAIEITYINNEGFIITSKEKKIIIDGLLRFDISEDDLISVSYSDLILD